MALDPLKKISQIKNLCLFSEFQQEANDFNRFNLIYGFNGSGKTTLSRLFRFFEKRELPNDFASTSFKIQLASGRILTQSDIFKPPMNFMVFNEDFIQDHLRWDRTETTTMVHLSGENEEFALRLQEIEMRSEEIINAIDKLEKLKRDHEKQIENIAFELAKGVRTVTLNHVHGYVNYQAPEVKKVWSELYDSEMSEQGLRKLVLSDGELRKYSSQSRQYKTCDPLAFVQLPIDPGDIEKIEVRIKEVLGISISAHFIKSLIADEKLHEWVRMGWNIHKKGEEEVCQFCRQTIPEERTSGLRAHFDEKYDQHILDLENLEIQLKDFIIQIDLREKTALSEDLQDEYEQLREKIKHKEQLFNNQIENLLKLINEKKSRPNKPILCETSLLKTIREITRCICDVNTLLTDHNGRLKKFDDIIKTAAKKIEQHIVGQQYPEYCRLRTQILDAYTELKTYDDELVILKSEKETLINELSSLDKAASAINKLISGLLIGHNIKIKVVDKRFLILRGENPAHYLSEGEKTAIAFAFFAAKLDEQGFNKSESVIVIDDPVSSLDSANVYKVVGYIRATIKSIGQAFILTHNFEFFREMKGYLRGEKMENQSELYSLDTSLEKQSSNVLRKAKMTNLDPLLLNYDSEYHYLFSELEKYRRSSANYERAYRIPNIARKFLECFLAFWVPDKKGLDGLDELLDDASLRNQVNRFINFHSHKDYVDGFTNFDLTVLSGSKDITDSILKAVKEKAPDHYKRLLHRVVV